MDILDLIAKMSKEFAKFKIERKDTSKLIKIISWLLYVITFGSQKTFMTSYVTTIGNTVYIPVGWDSWATDRKISVLKHERVHMRQAKKYGKLLYSFLYLFIWFPFGFAYYRTKFEKEAYIENIKFNYEKYGEGSIRSEHYKEFIVKQFISGNYGWMCPFRKRMEKWYDETVEKVINKTI